MQAVAFRCRLCKPHLNEPPAAPQRGGEKTCRSCWNVVASLRSHNNTLSDLNSDLMPDDPQHTAVFLSGVAALRAELGGPVSFQKVKHLLIKQVTLLVRDTRQHEVKRPFRPLEYRHIHSSTSKKIRIVVNHIGCKEPSVGINSSSCVLQPRTPGTSSIDSTLCCIACRTATAANNHHITTLLVALTACLGFKLQDLGLRVGS